MEVEKPAEEFSKEELRRQLYTSLRSTGVLDSMKGQLRARLLEHLRHHNGDSIEPKKKQGKPSLTARLLSCLFLDYLESNGFTFTISVFMPESQMASWPPFSYEEMLELLHLDPSSDLHVQLKLSGEGRECLAHQLVTMLQQMGKRSSIQEVSTQTSPAQASKRAIRTSCTSPREFERSIKEVDDAYFRKEESHQAQSLLAYRPLEYRLTILHQEFDARVNAEVALQVSRIRDYEINAARLDEAARYRRQLARDREELEDIHKSRMDRIKAREESLLERMLSKEKAIEASAYEQRQKILTEITSLREREGKLRQLKESQEHREEKLDEREVSLRAMEEEVTRERKALYAQADEIATSKRKELEEHYRELCDRLHHDQTLLAAEREQRKEEKVAMAIELAASRSDKELIQALHRRLSMEEDQRLNFVKSIRELEEKLKQQSSPAPALVNVPDQRLEERLRELQAELQGERLHRQAIEKGKKILERKLQQKKEKLAAAQSPQGDWITEHKNLMATIYQHEAELQKKETKIQLVETEKEKLTNRHQKLLLKIDHLDTLVRKAQEEKDHALYNLEILQVQLTTNETPYERELLETTTLLRKAQQALEAERLEHCALRSRMNAGTPIRTAGVNRLTPQRDYGSQDKYELSNDLVDHDSGVDEILRKKQESFQKKPQRQSREVWTLSANAAQKPSFDQDFERMPFNHFQTSVIPKPFSSGFGYQFSELHDDVSITEPLREPDWLQHHAGHFHASSHADEILSQSAEARSHCVSDARETLSSLSILRTPELSPLSTEDVNWKISGEAKSSNPNDMNGWEAITVEKMSIVEGDTTLATKTGSLMETVGDGSIEGLSTSWDQEKYGEHSYDDALPSWRKTCMPEVANKPATCNNGCEDAVNNVQSMVRNLQFSRSEVHIGDCGSIKDQENPWNTRQYGDHRHEDITMLSWNFRGGEKMAGKCDNKETLSGVQSIEVATEIPSASILKINNSDAYIRNLENPDATVDENAFSNSKSSQGKEKYPLEVRHKETFSTMHDTTTLTRAQRDSLTMEINCKGRLGSFYTQDVFGNHTQEDAILRWERSFSTEQDHTTNIDEKLMESQSSAHGIIITTANHQTDMDTIEDLNPRDLRSPSSSEKHKSFSPSNIASYGERQYPEVEDIENPDGDGDFSQHGIKVITRAEEVEERQGAESSWIPYLGEQKQSTRDNCGAEENLSQNSPLCKCMTSLKYDVESLGDSTQRRREFPTSNSYGPQVDSHSEGDHQTAIDSSTKEVHKPSTIVSEMNNERPLNLSAENIESRNEKNIIQGYQHHSISESRNKTIDSPVLSCPQRPAETQGDEAREMDARGEGELLACEPVLCDPTGTLELMKVANEVIKVAMDISSPDPTITHSEETADSTHSPTLFVSDGDIDDDPDKDLSHLMSRVGLATTTNDEAKDTQRLNTNREEPTRRLLHENLPQASGKMSGLPEIGEMLYKQEMHTREKSQDSTTQAQNPIERMETDDNEDISLDSQGTIMLPDRDALETLRTSIVMRKQELPTDKEAEKESPRVMDWMGGHKSHPTLVLAIRNNQLVKLANQDEFQKGEKNSSFLSQSHAEVIINNKTPCDEHAPASHTGTDSCSGESTYKGDSFEEEEEEEGEEEPAYSKESCTHAGVRMLSVRAPGPTDMKINEQFSPKSKTKVEGNESRSLEGSENWEGESEQGSYSPKGEDTVAESAEWLDTCGSQRTTNALGQSTK